MPSPIGAGTIAEPLAIMVVGCATPRLPTGCDAAVLLGVQAGRDRAAVLTPYGARFTATAAQMG